MSWAFILTTWGIGAVLVGVGLAARFIFARPVQEDEFEHWASDCPWPLAKSGPDSGVAEKARTLNLQPPVPESRVA